MIACDNPTVLSLNSFLPFLSLFHIFFCQETKKRPFPHVVLTSHNDAMIHHKLSSPRCRPVLLDVNAHLFQPEGVVCPACLSVEMVYSSLLVHT